MLTPNTAGCAGPRDETAKTPKWSPLSTLKILQYHVKNYLFLKSKDHRDECASIGHDSTYAFTCWFVLISSRRLHENHSLWVIIAKQEPLGQRSPAFLARGTGFLENSFSTDWGGGMFSE